MSDQSTAAKLVDSAKSSRSLTEFIGAFAIVGAASFITWVVASKPTTQNIYAERGASVDSSTHNTVNYNSSTLNYQHDQDDIKNIAKKKATQGWLADSGKK